MQHLLLTPQISYVPRYRYTITIRITWIKFWTARCTLSNCPDCSDGGYSVKVFIAIVFLAVFLSAILLSTETHAMATIARTFCIISTAIFAGAATLGLASRSKI